MKKYLGNLFQMAVVTAGVIVLYELSTLLLIYKYFRFDYFIAMAAITAFFAGVMLTRRYIVSPKGRPNPVHLLSVKECRVLELMAEGKSNKEIAGLNFVELSTVKTHINNIFSKLNVKNRREAINIFRNQMIPQKSTLFPPPAV